jgi:hypothetical protein
MIRFDTEISADRVLHLPAGVPLGPVTVTVTPQVEPQANGQRLLRRLLELQKALPDHLGRSQELLDQQLEAERDSWR